MIISKNAVKIIVFFLSFIGLEVSDDGIVEVIAAVSLILAFAFDLWQQIKRKDSFAFLFKKK